LCVRGEFVFLFDDTSSPLVTTQVSVFTPIAFSVVRPRYVTYLPWKFPTYPPQGRPRVMQDF